MLKKLTVPQQAWVDALRSGEYEQTTMTLQYFNEFCCLGVACKVAEKDGVKLNKDGNCLFGETLEDQPDVVDWLQLKNDSVKIGSSYITHFNDDAKMTFSELADVIEWNADRLFKE